MGRRKIKMERIVDKHDRFICFSKRRKGLYKKANYLALQGFHIIILVFSGSGNAFVYCSENGKKIIERFVNNSDATNGAGSGNAAENSIDEMRRKTAAEISKESGDSWSSLSSIFLTESEHLWWNGSVENLSWENLLQFKSAIEDLLRRVRAKANSLLVEQNFLSEFT